jgi:hypothetical protein
VEIQAGTQRELDVLSDFHRFLLANRCTTNFTIALATAAAPLLQGSCVCPSHMPAPLCRTITRGALILLTLGLGTSSILVWLISLHRRRVGSWMETTFRSTVRTRRVRSLSCGRPSRATLRRCGGSCGECSFAGDDVTAAVDVVAAAPTVSVPPVLCVYPMAPCALRGFAARFASSSASVRSRPPSAEAGSGTHRQAPASNKTHVTPNHSKPTEDVPRKRRTWTCSRSKASRQSARSQRRNC